MYEITILHIEHMLVAFSIYRITRVKIILNMCLGT